MNLPKQVRQQLEHVEQMLAPAPAPTPEPAAPPATVPEPAAPTEAAPQPAEPNAPDAAAPAPAAPSGEPWEARYKTLQGVFNKRVNDERRAREAAEQERDALKNQLNAAPATKPEVSLDPKDAETFGADLVGMAQRVAEQVATATVKQFDARLAALEQQLTGTTRAVAQTAEEIFLSRLAAAVPDYAKQNEDEGFLAWLAEVDPVYGAPRQDALTAASNALDAERTARIFLAYKATLAPAPAPSPAPRQTPAQSLERQVAPGTNAQPAQLQPQQAAPITVAEVQSFYMDVQRGVYKGRHEEMLRREAAINQALAEGRILESVPRRPV